MRTPMTKPAFTSALHSGRGSALQHVQQFGLSGVSDIVLDACVHNHTYDPQCESRRASWLLSMFERTEEYPAFSRAIIDALEQDTKSWDLQQLCDLAALMAKRGDGQAGAPGVRIVVASPFKRMIRTGATRYAQNFSFPGVQRTGAEQGQAAR